MGGCNSSESVDENGNKINFNKEVKDLIANNKVMVFSKSYCPFCSQLKLLFTQKGLSDYQVIEMDNVKNGDSYHSALKSLSGQRTVPNVYVNGQHVGGMDDTRAAANNGKLKQLLDAAGVQHQF